MIDLNINQMVEIVLTDLGASVYNKATEFRRESLIMQGKAQHPKYMIKAGGDVVRLRMWEMMQIFGRFMGPGLPAPFKPSIKIETGTSARVKAGR